MDWYVIVDLLEDNIVRELISGFESGHCDGVEVWGFE